MNYGFQQRITRRKSSPVLSRFRPAGKAAYRPEGYGFSQHRNFIDVIKQKPVKPVKLRRPKKLHTLKKAARVKESKKIIFPKFSFKIPFKFVLPRLTFFRNVSAGALPFPMAPVFILTAIAVFSVLCLNWQGTPLSVLNAQSPRPSGDLFPEPPVDLLYRTQMTRYAGLESAMEEAGELIPLDMPETFAWETYKVKRGDSVSKIAGDHALSYDAVISSNGMTNARLLREGDVLRLPNMDGIAYKVKAGDTLSKISAGYGIPLEAILDANDLASETLSSGTVIFLPGAKMRTEDLKLALGELFIYPIRGRLTSPFGWRNDPFTGVRRYHTAIDMAASTGTPVKAAMDGKVEVAGYSATFGKYIILKHDNGYQSMYAHLSEASVNQGASVRQGSKIGEVGSTGYSTGPHLHFAVYKNGRAVNPLDYLTR
ncbi:hypothetical protein AGMMS49928_07690 [Spirochaetia bacterium]|nr:hypothetical protein AGMMS49928_07690 [Spirochaetia bacterium]